MAEPQTRYVTGPDGEPYAVPSDATDQMISAYFKAIPSANAKDMPKARTWTDTAVDALPWVGGTAGAVLGGPMGAILGAGGGEAYRQLINRARGADAPKTMTEASDAIGENAVTAGAMDLGAVALGAGVSAAKPMIAKALQATGKTMASPMTLRRLAGKGIEAAGNALTETPVVPKVAITAMDFTRIKSLMSQGLSEGEAVRTVLNLKAKAMR